MRRLLRAALIAGASLSIGGCHRTKNKFEPIKASALPSDDVQAAKAVGEAAAKDKDAAKLAGTLLAFMDRLHVAVVSTDGSKMLTHGELTGPIPQQFWLWEPVLFGVARATVLGDERLLPVILQSFFPSASQPAPDLDLGKIASEYADEADHGSHDPRVLLGAALAADLLARAELRAHPRLDPTATLLLGLLLLANRPSAVATVAPSTPAPQASVHGFKLPKLPPIPNVAHAMGVGSASAAVCGFMAKAFGTARGAKSAAGFFGITPGKIAGLLGASSEMQGYVGGAAKSAGGVVGMATTIMSGISGMGIAAFVDVQGEVKPPKVAYGDGPVKYRVGVVSTLPVKKDQLDQVVKCIDAMDPAGAFSSLDDIPPNGVMKNVPVYWEKTDVYDPKHGHFSTDHCGTAQTPVPFNVGAGTVTNLLSKWVNFTGNDGVATATFQVKPARKKKGAAKFERYVISADVFPFPIKQNVVYAGANILFSRAMPLALEIKVPMGDWIMTLSGKSMVHPMGMMGEGFMQTISGKVPVKVNDDMTISGQGTASGSYSMPTQQNGPATCDAPAVDQPYDVKVTGRLKNMSTGEAEIHLSITSPKDRAPMKITCRVAGHSSSRGSNARLGTDITAGTEAASFSMPLDEDSTKKVSLSKSVAVVNITGSLDVTVNVADEP